jgi:hypothetical protein
LHLYTAEEIDSEIERAEIAIEGATGVRTTGFRGPGYSLSETVLKVLHDRGYSYDCSTFPTFIGPLARAYYFLRARLDQDQKEKRKTLFGGMRDGLRPLAPYDWNLGSGRLLEIPVTTMPLTKFPIHFSYLHWLAGRSEALANTYFVTALRACDLFSIEPSLLLHPLDFLGGDDSTELAFFPGMNQTGKVKMDRMRRLLSVFNGRYDIGPMGVHAARIAARKTPLRQPDFKINPDMPRNAATVNARER